METLTTLVRRLLYISPGTKCFGCALFVALGVAAGVPDGARAQSPGFVRDCQDWIDKKGYSSDYIEQKTGKRQPGLPGSWRGNVPLQQVEPGDVVLIRLRAPGAMHASLVEEVRRSGDGGISGIRVSEWNWGPMAHQRCLITENFGRLAPLRWVDLGSIGGVWRPSLPLAQ